MSNELEKKLKILTDLMVGMDLGKDEVVKLVKNLLSEYKISFADLYPEMAARFDEMAQLSEKLHKSAQGLTVKIENHSESAEPKGTALPLEVIYEPDLRSKQVIVNRTPIGVVLGNGKVLYWKQSENIVRRRQAIEAIRSLPVDYNWRMLSEREASYIRSIVGKVNQTLRLIGGDVLGSQNYMLAEDGQYEGKVCYIADL